MIHDREMKFIIRLNIKKEGQGTIGSTGDSI